MKITFLGTRGNITARSKKHYRHTITLFSKGRNKLLIDAGKDWRGKLDKFKPDVILITHAHPDHAEGLKKGSLCPVYATLATWHIMKNYAIHDRRIIVPQTKYEIAGFTVEAFEVDHALNAPAVGYRISDGDHTVFYVPDLVKIKKQKEALKKTQLYIGDGAIMARTLLVKKRGRTYIGHSPIEKQLKWCHHEKVPRAIFTHCGTEIVTGKPEVIEEKIKDLEEEYNVKIEIAYDGMVVKI